MFETNTYVCFNTSRVVHLTRFGSLLGHFWPPDLLFDTPGPEKGGPSSPVLAPGSGHLISSVWPSAPEISPASAPRRGLCEISDRSEYQFNFNGRQALFIHTTHSLKLVSISSYKSESQSPLQPPFKQALCCCFRPPDVRNL